MNNQQLYTYIEQQWQDSALSTLKSYIEIPNKSPLFDQDWQKNGHIEAAIKLIVNWCNQQMLEGQSVQVLRLPGRTPLLVIEIPGALDQTVLLYGHLDKQPEMAGWHEGLEPWTPVELGDKLYGRGSADDGYAVFSALIAIQALQNQRIPHARCVIIIESSEESGSPDLPCYIESLRPWLKQVDLVICLDSGCGDYQHLWLTTSLRGLVNGQLQVQILKEGVHSGSAGGIVPSSFRIMRMLLDRIEQAATGTIQLPTCNVPIPTQREQEADCAAAVLGQQVFLDMPWHGASQPVNQQIKTLLLNRAWRPALSITGCAGLPELAKAGNVLRPETTLQLSLRIPPMCDAKKVGVELTDILQSTPPYGATVKMTIQQAVSGWQIPEAADWLQQATQQASILYFKQPAQAMGEGGSIPFMHMLGALFPQAQFMITGVLGPQSNAHGPNEFLHLPTAKRVTACVAHVLAQHFLQVEES